MKYSCQFLNIFAVRVSVLSDSGCNLNDAKAIRNEVQARGRSGFAPKTTAPAGVRYARNYTAEGSLQRLKVRSTLCSCTVHARRETRVTTVVQRVCKRTTHKRRRTVPPPPTARGLALPNRTAPDSQQRRSVAAAWGIRQPSRVPRRRRAGPCPSLSVSPLERRCTGPCPFHRWSEDAVGLLAGVYRLSRPLDRAASERCPHTNKFSHPPEEM